MPIHCLENSANACYATYQESAGSEPLVTALAAVLAAFIPAQSSQHGPELDT